MGFIRQQEEKLAVRFLSWQYEKLKKPIPDEAELRVRQPKLSRKPTGLRVKEDEMSFQSLKTSSPISKNSASLF